MANLITLYWRDIPAQVIAERGRGRKREQAKIELQRRFAIAIDAAAMRDGADSTDDYIGACCRAGSRLSGGTRQAARREWWFRAGLTAWYRHIGRRHMSHPEESGASASDSLRSEIAILPAIGKHAGVVRACTF